MVEFGDPIENEFKPQGLNVDSVIEMAINRPIIGAVFEGGFFTVDADGLLIQQEIVTGVAEESGYSGGTNQGFLYNDNGTIRTSAMKWRTDGLELDRLYSNVFRDSVYGNNWMLFTNINAATSELTIGNGSIQKLSFSLKVGAQIGFGTTTPGAFAHYVQNSDIVGFRLDMENLQGSDPFQINAFNTTGGTSFRIDASGNLYGNSIYVKDTDGDHYQAIGGFDNNEIALYARRWAQGSHNIQFDSSGSIQFSVGMTATATWGMQWANNNNYAYAGRRVIEAYWSIGQQQTTITYATGLFVASPVIDLENYPSSHSPVIAGIYVNPTITHLGGARFLALYSKKGEIELMEPGEGMICVSPDGLIRKRVGIDNSGNVTATIV